MKQWFLYKLPRETIVASLALLEPSRLCGRANNTKMYILRRSLTFVTCLKRSTIHSEHIQEIAYDRNLETYHVTQEKPYKYIRKTKHRPEVNRWGLACN